MLDLDSLAEKRALALNQGKNDWFDAVWSMGFQKLSQSMSDGEVESLISWCSSVNHVYAVVKHLDGRCGEGGPSPFAVLMADAEADGMQPGEWIQQKLGAKK